MILDNALARFLEDQCQIITFLNLNSIKYLSITFLKLAQLDQSQIQHVRTKWLPKPQLNLITKNLAMRSEPLDCCTIENNFAIPLQDILT